MNEERIETGMPEGEDRIFLSRHKKWKDRYMIWKEMEETGNGKNPGGNHTTGRTDHL